ncbi:MAG: PhoH family protein [Verrucomicrobia bacterium]|nr:PhoH family protein [Verrucomicrobiota bacterium]
MQNFILDTNVLLHDPTAIYHFKENHVVIPLKVLEEIDQFKRELSERGRNARTISRSLDELRKQGRLSDGVALESGGTIRVIFADKNNPFSVGLSADDLILTLAMDLQKAQPDTRCVVVSKDINLRLKADALGLEAEDYENGKTREADELYTGQTVMDADSEAIGFFAREGHAVIPGMEALYANQYVTLRNPDDLKQTMLARYDAETHRLVKLLTISDISPIAPRNREQRFAMDALLNDKIKLVTLSGKAGTGKTLLAIAAGYHQVMETKYYKRLLVSRPIFPMGRDLGYLPGTIEEKLDPWMQPIHDALSLIVHTRPGMTLNKKGADFLASNPLIDVEPLTYIRGRSIPNQFMIVDESQNLTPLEVKTVITRVGHDTKIVLTGDLYQIDNPYVDSLSNGLSAVVEKFRGEPLAAHILLTEGVRSELAEKAANLL